MRQDRHEQDVKSQLPNLDFDAGRRAFISALGLGAAGAAILSGASTEAFAAPSDTDIFNFALNFEYLGAEFYSYAVTGSGLPTNLTAGGNGAAGAAVLGGRKVPFQSKYVAAYALQLMQDEVGHVKVVRAALGSAAIPQPEISLGPAFAMAAKAAGIAGEFNVFANDVNFLLGAYVLEDVCVTALRGAAPLIQNPANLDAAAGLLGAESYQAGMIRVKLFTLASTGQGTIFADTTKISNLRARLTNGGNPSTDQPIGVDGMANIVPTDGHSLVFPRSPREILNIAYGQPNATKGLFFPKGVNGTIQ